MACTTTSTISFEKVSDFYWNVNWENAYMGRLVLDSKDNRWRFVSCGFGVLWLTEEETFLLFAKLRSIK